MAASPRTRVSPPVPSDRTAAGRRPPREHTDTGEEIRIDIKTEPKGA